MYCILILSPVKKHTGNLTTTARLQVHLQESGFHCHVKDAQSLTSCDDVRHIVKQEGIHLILAIHAYHAGRHLQGSGVPYVLILGGTDLYIESKYPDRLATMLIALDHARSVVAFGSSMEQTAHRLWPQCMSQFCTIPQAIQVSPSEGFNLIDYLQKTEMLQTPTDVTSSNRAEIFLLVAGIRPVKDPLFLVQAFSEWHRHRRPSAYFVILGPQMDAGFQELFLSTINSLAGVVYIPGLCLEDTHAAIKQSSALINSSVSEGMAATVLEAMSLGTPVLARDIIGNRDLVIDHENGLLFSTPQEFIEKADELLMSHDLRNHIINNARMKIDKQHSVSAEKEAYVTLINSIILSS